MAPSAVMEEGDGLSSCFLAASSVFDQAIVRAAR
jgi:hypothetical protein